MFCESKNNSLFLSY